MVRKPSRSSGAPGAGMGRSCPPRLVSTRRAGSRGHGRDRAGSAHAAAVLPPAAERGPPSARPRRGPPWGSPARRRAAGLPEAPVSVPSSRRSGAVVVLLAVLLALAGPASAAPPHGSPPGHGAADGALLVIGHRGAAGYRPEHTLASYELAARMGADYVECDVVSTADGVLVCRHENDISGTTDVADHPEFADRRTTKVVDGVSLTGWFTEDFTLEELRALRAVERLPDVREENTLYNGLYPVPTLEEYLDLRERLSEELGREVGAYIETKHPTYFDSIGLSLEEPLLAALHEAGLDRPGAPVF